MRRGRATGARRWRWACALGACIVVAGGSASAAGTRVAVTYRIVEARGIEIATSTTGGVLSGGASWSGAGARVSVEVGGSSPGSSVEVTAGGTEVDVASGGAYELPRGSTSLRYRLVPAAGRTAVTLVVSAP